MATRRIWIAPLSAFVCATAACSGVPAPGAAQTGPFIELNGRRLSTGDEFVLVDGPRRDPAPTQSSASVQVIWGGIQGDSTTQISAAEARGRLVVMLASESMPQPDSTSQPAVEPRFRDAFAIAIIVDNLAALGQHPKTVAASSTKNASFLYITTGVASQLLGRETIDREIEPGTPGRTVRALLRAPDR